MFRPLFVGVTLFLSVVPALCAQSVRGTLLEEGTGKRIQGALVVLLDPNAAQRAAVLTDASGDFLLPAPAPGRYSLRAERVGYSSTTSPVLDLEIGRTIEYRLAAPVEPVELKGLTVSSRRRCELRPREGGRAHTLWEEARKALSTAAWAKDAGLFRFRVLRYERELEPKTLKVREQETREKSGISANPFISLPAETLAEQGYVQATSDGETYYAPDAHVLLSDAFLDQHCFRVTSAEEEQEGLVGLAFEPVRARKLPDVRGVLWLDENTAELRHLEYSYTGLASFISTQHAGGRLEFERLPGGAWIVRRWRIRMPRLGTRSVRWGGAIARRSEVLLSVGEEGGEVTEVLTAGGDPIRATAYASLTGTVFDSIRSIPLADATVFLVGTDRRATADAKGRFELARLPTGTHSLTFTHPRLDSLGYSPVARSVTLSGGGTATTELSIPSEATIRTAACDPRSDDHGIVFGLVENRATGIPLAGARVIVSWEGSAETGDLPAQVEVRTDARGRYLFCTVPVGRRLTIEAEFLRHQSQGNAIAVSHATPLEHTVSMRAFESIVRTADGTEFGAVLQPVTLTGRIVNAATLEPMVGANARLRMLGAEDGGVRPTGQVESQRRTDKVGRFVFQSVEPGMYRLEIEHPDYDSYSEVISIGGGGAVELEVRIPAPVKKDGGSP